MIHGAATWQRLACSTQNIHPKVGFFLHGLFVQIQAPAPFPVGCLLAPASNGYTASHYARPLTVVSPCRYMHRFVTHRVPCPWRFVRCWRASLVLLLHLQVEATACQCVLHGSFSDPHQVYAVYLLFMVDLLTTSTHLYFFLFFPARARARPPLACVPRQFFVSCLVESKTQIAAEAIIE